MRTALRSSCGFLQLDCHALLLRSSPRVAGRRVRVIGATTDRRSGIPRNARGAPQAGASNRRAARAATSSSRARMTSTRTAEPSAAMSQSGTSSALRRRSSSTPRNPSRAQTRSRTNAEFSPIPAVKTSASRPAGRDSHRGDRAGNAIGEDLEREPCALVSGARTVLELAHVPGPAEALEAGLGVQLTIDLSGAEAVLAEDVDQRARIDRTCAARHRDALERREPHCRVAGAAVPNRRDGATAAQVADDEAKTLGRTAQKLRSPLRAPFDRQSVEAVPADPPVGPPALG